MTTWADFWASVLPPLAVALLAILSAMASLAVSYLRAMQRKYDEAANREALHSAISTGVKAEMSIDPFASDKQIMASTSKYVLDAGAPEAAKAFGLSSANLNKLVTSKISEERERALLEPKSPCP